MTVPPHHYLTNLTMVQVFTSSMVAMAVVGAASRDAARYGATTTTTTTTIAGPYHWVGDHAMGIVVSEPFPSAGSGSSASFTAV